MPTDPDLRIDRAVPPPTATSSSHRGAPGRRGSIDMTFVLEPTALAAHSPSCTRPSRFTTVNHTARHATAWPSLLHPARSGTAAQAVPSLSTQRFIEVRADEVDHGLTPPIAGPGEI